MKYADLLPIFARYHRGELTRSELECAICMWQRQGARL